MRSDMSKVIVERPRRGGGEGFPRHGNPADIEDSQRRQGMRRPWLSGNYKTLNENLAPLRRYLRSNVGRPWNKVYSEVCERINRNSAVQIHVWQHLMEEVCRDPHVIAGDVKPRYWPLFGSRFYVDPKSGLLRESKYRGRRVPGKSEPPLDRIWKDESREFRRIDGIWYSIQFASMPADGAHFFDVLQRRGKGELFKGDLVKLYGRTVYAAGKRQLNKKEIRRLPVRDMATPSR